MTPRRTPLVIDAAKRLPSNRTEPQWIVCPPRPRGCARLAVRLSDLKAVFINCTLKRSPWVSNTAGLADLAMTIMRRTGVAVELIRAVDNDIATGVWPGMIEHGWEGDDRPAISEKVTPPTLASRLRSGASSASARTASSGAV